MTETLVAGNIRALAIKSLSPAPSPPFPEAMCKVRRTSASTRLVRRERDTLPTPACCRDRPTIC